MVPLISSNLWSALLKLIRQKSSKYAQAPGIALARNFTNLEKAAGALLLQKPNDYARKTYPRN